MAKRNRIPKRAKNKIESSGDGVLIKLDSPPAFVEAPQGDQVTQRVKVARSTLFTAELEAIIEIIARERVYRAMMAGLNRRLYAGPAPHPGAQLRIAE